MNAKINEAIVVLQREKECVQRQDTPDCNRDCKNCNLVLPTEKVLRGYDTAIKALEDVEADEKLDRAGLRLVWQQTGEWIVVGRAAYGYVDIECPCCKHLRQDIQADNKPNFCENCGADMRKG